MAEHVVDGEDLLEGATFDELIIGCDDPEAVARRLQPSA